MMEFSFGNNEDAVRWLKDTKLITQKKRCDNCQRDMRWAKKKACQDGYIWVCGKCDKSCSICDGKLCCMIKFSRKTSQ
jgi:hypothetical protein